MQMLIVCCSCGDHPRLLRRHLLFAGVGASRTCAPAGTPGRQAPSSVAGGEYRAHAPVRVHLFAGFGAPRLISECEHSARIHTIARFPALQFAVRVIGMAPQDVHAAIVCHHVSENLRTYALKQHVQVRILCSVSKAVRKMACHSHCLILI